MTALEWLIEQWPIIKSQLPPWLIQQALEMEKEQIKQTVLNLLHHELGHDDTARWLAERLEAGEIDVNDL